MLQYREGDGVLVAPDIDGAEVAVPLRLGAARALGKISLGLSHHGYSGEDPDGRGAVLTLTLATIQAAGPQPAAGPALLSIESLSPVEVDVELPQDAAEEGRLRQAWKLPRKLDDGLRLPLQVRWQGVDGRTLYRRLTEPDGLRFTMTLRIRGAVTLPLQREIALSCVEEAFQALGGSPAQLAWSGGAAPLAAVLMQRGCVGGIAASKVYPAGFALPLIAAIEAAYAPGQGLHVVLARNLVAQYGAGQARRDSPFDLRVRVPYRPGNDLKTNPSLVRDLTNSASGGLEALLPPPDGANRDHRR